MKDYRRAGQSLEQFVATLKTYEYQTPVQIHGRMGCVNCAIETGRFFVYSDMLVCIYCSARFALKDPIFPEQTHVSQRLVCAKCHGFHWWVEKAKVYCKCGNVRPAAAEIKPVPLFEYFELPEPAHFGMDAKAEIKKLEA